MAVQAAAFLAARKGLQYFRLAALARFCYTFAVALSIVH